MPFVKGRYVPESEMQPAAENEQEQNKPAVREKKRVKEKRLKKKNLPAPELTPEELEAQRLEEERKIKESAERFERLISTDTPDLTQLNLLIEKEKKKEKSAWRKRAGSVKIMLTVLLLAAGADDNGYQLCFGNPYGHKPCVHGRTVRGIFPYGAAALKSPFLFANV